MVKSVNGFQLTFLAVRWMDLTAQETQTLHFVQGDNACVILSPAFGGTKNLLLVGGLSYGPTGLSSAYFPAG